MTITRLQVCMYLRGLSKGLQSGIYMQKRRIFRESEMANKALDSLDSRHPPTKSVETSLWRIGDPGAVVCLTGLTACVSVITP